MEKRKSGRQNQTVTLVEVMPGHNLGPSCLRYVLLASGLLAPGFHSECVHPTNCHRFSFGGKDSASKVQGADVTQWGHTLPHLKGTDFCIGTVFECRTGCLAKGVFPTNWKVSSPFSWQESGPSYTHRSHCFTNWTSWMSREDKENKATTTTTKKGFFF